MEEIDYEERTSATCVHKIYCDNCKKHIATVEEYDDGYYDDECIEESINLFGEWYGIRKQLCDECFKEFKKSNIINTFFELIITSFSKSKSYFIS